jgi:hypothetical protein
MRKQRFCFPDFVLKVSPFEIVELIKLVEKSAWAGGIIGDCLLHRMIYQDGV